MQKQKTELRLAKKPKYPKLYRVIAKESVKNKVSFRDQLVLGYSHADVKSSIDGAIHTELLGKVRMGFFKRDLSASVRYYFFKCRNGALPSEYGEDAVYSQKFQDEIDRYLEEPRLALVKKPA